jgi:hypothetical protein
LQLRRRLDAVFALQLLEKPRSPKGFKVVVDKDGWLH